MKEKSADIQAGPAVSLSYLLVETEAFQGQQDAQARVFNNGKQKCVALITLQALDSNGIVTTLPDDLNINLVPYSAASGGWVSDATAPEPGFLPFPEQIAGMADSGSQSDIPPLPSTNYQQFKRYITYHQVAQGAVIKFAARVKLTNVEYITNSPGGPYGGEGQNGRFNSSFRLKSVSPLQYAAHNNGLVVSEPVEVFSGVIDGYTTKVHNRYISLRYPATNTSVAFHPSSDTAVDSSLHDNKATAFGNPGNSISKKNIPADIQLGRALNQALATIRQPRSGAISVAVAIYSRVANFFSARQVSYYTKGMDVYGNSLRLMISLNSERPNRDPWIYTLNVDWAGSRAKDDDKPPLGSWLASLNIAIASASNRVYPNGRQQMEVTVNIEPLSSQKVSAEELASVKLIVRDELGGFTPLPESNDGSSPWFFSHRRNDYLEYPAVRELVPPSESANTPSSVYTRKFYVMANKANPSQPLETLYVGITRFTNNGNYDYRTDGSQDGFSSKVEVRTAEIPKFKVPDNYSFVSTLVDGNGQTDVFTLQYALAGANVQQPIVEFISADMTPKGMIQWDVKAAGATRATHVGFAPPGKVEIEYNNAIRLGTNFQPVRHVRNPVEGHVTLVLQSGNTIPFDADSAIHHNGPCVLTAVDVYGNEHQLRISFKDATAQGRLELVLT